MVVGRWLVLLAFVVLCSACHKDYEEVSLHVHHGAQTDTYSWRNGEAHMRLHSQHEQGVRVQSCAPVARCPWVAGDVILSVQGRDVTTVTQFLGQLKKAKATKVTVRVRHRGQIQTVTLAATQYRRWLPANAPTPPAPPPTPEISS